MTRTTLMLPDDIKLRTERRARELGISMGEFVRRSLLRALEVSDTVGADDPLYADHALAKHDTPADLAARHDDLLYGDLS